jgi:hypothetical protein
MFRISGNAFHIAEKQIHEVDRFFLRCDASSGCGWGKWPAEMCGTKSRGMPKRGGVLFSWLGEEVKTLQCES